MSPMTGTEVAERLARAGRELEATAGAIEEAAGTILDAAQSVLDLKEPRPDAYRAAVAQACRRIIEACTFQDIAGQRLAKVQRTLAGMAGGPAAPEGGTRAAEAAAGLLDGPALDGDGLGQNEIDALLAEDGDAKAR